jgi:hypothetical protein
VIKVFEDFDIALVGYYQSVLQADGIETFMKNQFGTSGAGELPFVEVIPQIWVLDDADVDKARSIILELQGSEEKELALAWDCPQCKEPQEAAFTNCWNCSASRTEATN